MRAPQRDLPEAGASSAGASTASAAKFGHFFLQWIKFNDNAEEFYKARGEAGESYLQFRLQHSYNFV